MPHWECGHLQRKVVQGGRTYSFHPIRIKLGTGRGREGRIDGQTYDTRLDLIHTREARRGGQKCRSAEKCTTRHGHWLRRVIPEIRLICPCSPTFRSWMPQLLLLILGRLLRCSSNEYEKSCRRIMAETIRTLAPQRRPPNRTQLLIRRTLKEEEEVPICLLPLSTARHTSDPSRPL